jgi:pantoate--beta-alanine ligase
MKIASTIAEVHEALAPSHRTVVGLVPTMGALHDGHAALFRAARPECDVLVASVFVNPAQFSDGGDLTAYPRDLDRDAVRAEGAGVDLLFTPAVLEMYPPGFATWVVPSGAAEGLEEEHRPGHFRGVATVCVKLFNIVQPGRAYFGQKDAQQAVVVRRVVRNLNLPLEIRVLPTIRDNDGLAVSSRNVLLSQDERKEALALPRALALGAEAYTQGGDPVAATRSAFNGATPDYVELVELDAATVLAAAIRVGPIRLIDNVLLKGELS